MINGEGVRVTLFVSGCNHRCEGCYNKSTWNPHNGTPFTADTLAYLLDLMAPDYIRGLSLTGGDPLYPTNMDWIWEICNAVRERYGDTKDIWMWTGYEYPKIQGFITFSGSDSLRYNIVHNFVDVLIDGKFVQELKDPTLRFRGSSNQNIINVKEIRDEKRLLLPTESSD